MQVLIMATAKIMKSTDMTLQRYTKQTKTVFKWIPQILISAKYTCHDIHDFSEQTTQWIKINEDCLEINVNYGLHLIDKSPVKNITNKCWSVSDIKYEGRHTDKRAQHPHYAFVYFTSLHANNVQLLDFIRDCTSNVKLYNEMFYSLPIAVFCISYGTYSISKYLYGLIKEPLCLVEPINEPGHWLVQCTEYGGGGGEYNESN
jgi:hypothetical protein